jgi:hypothetical protein
MKRLLRVLVAVALLVVSLPVLWIVGNGLAQGRDLAAAWRALRAPAPRPVAHAVALPDAPFGPPVHVGNVLDPELVEVSGLAASGRRDDLLWAVNDSGNPMRLHALSPTGEPRGAFDVEIGDAANDSDWEDLASFRFEDTPYLLIADVGDNWSWRRSVRLWIVAEPELPASATRLVPSARIELRFDDGPRDCEAVAVDPADTSLLLVSKRTAPPVVYRVELAPLLRAGGGAAVAQRLVALTGIPPPSTERADSPFPAMLHMPTALALAPGGSAAVVIGYAEGWRFPRRAGQSWAEAFAATPERVRMPPLPLAEAAAFLGPSLYVTSEMDPLTLVRWRAPLERLDPLAR